MKVLRAIGLLHAWTGATAKQFRRPRSSADVVSVGLRDTKVTDAGLKELAGLKNLTTLVLPNTGVTDAGLKELRQALPGCKIRR